jgi:fibronectin-binding autotransporter adhesin
MMTRMTRLVLACFLMLGLAASLEAQTWDGAGAGGGNVNWGNAPNWNPDGVPVSDGTANIIMAGTIDTANIVNVNFNINELLFDNTAGAFNISSSGGATLTIQGGGIRNNDTQSQTINVPIIMGASTSWVAAAGPLVFNTGSVDLGGNELFFVADTGSSGIAVSISGAGGSIVKDGVATLSLNANNSFDGGVTLKQGQLTLNNNNALGTGTLTIEGGTLNGGTAGAQRSLNNAVTVSNNFTTAGVQGITLNGPMTLVGSQQITVSNFDALVILGAIGEIGGSATLTKSGADLLTLGGSNTYTGGTRVLQGNLRISANERLADVSNLEVIGSSSTFNLQSFTETVGVVTLSGGGSITGNGTLIGSAYNFESGTVNAVLGGSGALAKNTSGTVTLSAANTYTGGTTINAGILQLGASDALPDTNVVTVASPGSLNVNNFIDFIGGLSGNGNVTLGSGTLIVGSGNASGTFSGVVSGTGSLNKIGTGVQTLSGANLYEGGTGVSQGTLRIGGSERLANTSDLIVDGGSAVFDLQSFTETVDAVTLANGGSITGSGTLIGSAYSLSQGSVSATLGGSAAVTKVSSGTVTLSGANTYSGGTVFNNGVLQISSDANLGVAGTSLNFNGGTLRPTSSFTLSRPITLNAGGGTIDTPATTTLTSTISGSGGLTKSGVGTLLYNSTSTLPSLTVTAGDFALPVAAPVTVTGVLTVGANGYFSSDGGLITAGNINNSGELELVNNARLVGPISNSGVLKGAGRITGALTNTSTGNVRLSVNDSIHFDTASASSNAGLIEVIGGEIEFDGTMTNAASTGMIAARNAGMRFNGGLTNAGSMALSFGTSDVFGDIANDSGASIVVSGGANATFYDDITQNGTFRVSAVGSTTSVAVVLGAFSGSGGSTGGGDIFFEGDLRPGNSPASVTFDNNVGFGDGATTLIELGGTTLGSQYDHVNVTGDLVLDGDLNIALLGGFTPSIGDSFNILDWGSLNGTFDAINLPALSGMNWITSQLYTTGTLLVALPGDFDADGDVDGRDFLIWQRGGSPSPLSASDLNDWQTNYGVGALSALSALNGGGTPPANAVPEPSGLVIVLGLLSLAARRRTENFS